MSRKIILLYTSFFVMSCFMSCKKESSRCTLTPKLNSILELYINKDSHASIIYVIFSRINGMNLVSFTDDDRYDKRRVDYYYKRGDKLILIYVTNYMNLDGYINKDSLNTFEGKIDGYSELHEPSGSVYSSNYIPNIKVYQIISPDSFTTKIALTDYRYIAKDNNVIRSNKINEIVNNYINRNPSVLYLLKMKKIKGHMYFVFEKSQFYEQKNLSGFFYRDNHLIALYNINNTDTNIVNTNDIIHEDEIKGFRESPLGLDWMLNFPEYYRILNNVPIRFNDDFELMYKIVN